MSRKYRRVSLKKELVDVVEKFIRNNPEYGYRSIAEFVEDAVRRRGEQVCIPAFKEKYPRRRST